MNFRRAEIEDIPFVLPLMRDFYTFERLTFDEQRSGLLLQQLIADDTLGQIILFEQSDRLCGYMVLTFGFSMEFHGQDALIDELYVVASGRGTFFVGGQRVPFGPRDALFVAAKVEHRFEGFSNDFATWVVFYGPPGGEQA